MRVLGLTDYRLTVADLAKLGARSVDFSLQLRGRSLSGLVRFPPKQRDALLRVTLKRQCESLARRFPEGALVSRDARKGSWTLDGSLPANRIQALASRAEVASVWIAAIEGRSRRPQPRKLAWFCVWGIVAVQVEGRRRGKIDLEDRLVLVKGYDEEDAKSRLRLEWARYAAPYMNPNGHLVRWQLVSVRDVYAVVEDELSPRGTEVYSRLRASRMKPEYRWLDVRGAAGEIGAGKAPIRRRWRSRIQRQS